jgi:hypothetical protein
MRDTLTKWLNDAKEQLADGMIIARLPGLLGLKLGREWRIWIYDATEMARV